MVLFSFDVYVSRPFSVITNHAGSLFVVNMKSSGPIFFFDLRLGGERSRLVPIWGAMEPSMRLWGPNGCSDFLTPRERSPPMRFLGSKKVEVYWVYKINSPVQQEASESSICSLYVQN